MPDAAVDASLTGLDRRPASIGGGEAAGTGEMSIGAQSRHLPRPRREAMAIAVGGVFTMMLGLSMSGRAQPPAPRPIAPASAMGPVSPDLARAPERSYALTQPLNVQRWSPSGWGLSATWRGRSTDMSSWNGWRDDPDARPGEAEAGLSWHGRDMSFMAGYAQPEFGAEAARYPHSPHPQGLMGLNVTFSTR
jgi:hypothetical protein